MGMVKKCLDSEYWDHLVKHCMDCHTACQYQPVISKCTNYCASAKCKALPGHQYDRLLKKCVNCTEICGRHLAECTEHCQTLPTPMTTKNLIEVTTLAQTSKVPTSRALENSALLLYSLLAVCIVLLFSNLFIALVVFVRGRRTKASKRGSIESTEHKHKGEVPPEQDVRLPGSQLGPYCPTNTEPTDDCSPTETCVCVHCFPDLKALSQVNDRSPRAPSSTYQHNVLHRAQVQNGSLAYRTEENFHNYRLAAQEEAAVG
ncbi:tumor necrosis factor receptor superfamily member 13B [Parambassis ranga]|uniref:Tumor necrosis factor receptor superfamily member 13B n=1 Tax=Parambassis ranga TaxID=210632 RepID=A0A6P7IEY3_9TELE|nr:tumor necrosis factor receptor superfamily member 13B [Parambassis ranga]XP_028264153.1 tumor necrosis factor receptor superfamily member 13B [Parambassis ranga]